MAKYRYVKKWVKKPVYGNNGKVIIKNNYALKKVRIKKSFWGS